MRDFLKYPGLRDALLVLLAGTLMLAWSSLPNWSAYAAEDQQYAFSGGPIDMGDYAVHIAMLRAGMQGEWTYQLRFTSEPHQGHYIRMFYLLLGQANRLLRIEPERLFQMARWLLGYAALFALFSLLKRVFSSRASLWTAFFLAALGSGLGFLQLVAGWVPGPYTPVDLWLIDAYVLFSIALFPHFSLTLVLMCVALAQFLDYLERGSFRHVLIVAAAGILVQVINPIAFVVIDIAISATVLAAWWRDRKIRWEQAGSLALIAAAQVPLLIYNFGVLQNDPIWSQFTLQNETLSPPPIYYLWGFGLLWPPAIAGAIRAMRCRQPALIGAAAWVVAALLLAYAPFAIQRRFLLGITIPIGMLAAWGIEGLAGRLRQGSWLQAHFRPLSTLFILSTALTSLLLSPSYAMKLSAQPQESFYPRVLNGAFAWISQHTAPDDLVFGAEDTGRLTAEKTGRRVYLGHEMETLAYPEKVAAVTAFYRGQAGAGWLRQNRIAWVAYGPYERKLAPGFQPPAGLDLVFDEQGVQIYHVR